MELTIDALERVLGADLATAGKQFFLERVSAHSLEPPEGVIQWVRSHVPVQISDMLETQPAPLPEALRVGVGDSWTGLLFFAHLDFLEQAEQHVHSAQDVVVEETFKAWPPCPGHAHPMIPRISGRDIFWTCPATGTRVVMLGLLSTLDD